MTKGSWKVLARLCKTVVLLSLLAAGGGGLGFWQLYRWAVAPQPIGPEQIVDLAAGTSLSRLAAKLESQGLVSSALEFQLWVRASTSYTKFQAGKYRFTEQVSPAQISNAMVRGDIYHPIVLQYTIPEGFALKLICERLAARNVGTLKDLAHLAHDPQFLHDLKIPSTSLEGYIYPATYTFTEMPTAAQALQLMVKTFWKNLPKDYESRAKAMGLTLNQAVTFGSLIELETLHDDEKPLISEVIWRRLKDKAPIGIDAAIIYGIHNYRGDLRWKHLQDASNLYNTRIHPGLPPTPIASPSVRSLLAVLTPSNYGYYYYVLVPGTGRHHFSRTLKEHNEHVRELVGKLKVLHPHSKNEQR